MKSGNEKAVLNINAGRTESALSVCKNKQIALILLKNGAELKAGNDKIFPYHRFPDEEMIKIAIKNNYDMDTLDSEKDTVLMKAVRSSETGAVQKLYQNSKTASGKFWTVPDAKNNSPMQTALEFSKPEVLEILSKYNEPDLKKLNSDKWSVLHSAVQAGHFPYLQAVLKNAPKEKKELLEILNRKTECSFLFNFVLDSVHIAFPCTALGIGFVHHGKSRMTDLLESLGGKIDGGEILQLVNNRDYLSMDYLDSKRTRINWNHSYKGITSLMLAALRNDVKLAKYLVAKGADKKQKDEDGNTAKNWIIITPAAEMHKLLEE